MVASLSCKFLNTTSCQGPLPTAPGPCEDDLELSWECQAWAPPPAQPWPAVPARRSAWPTRETRCLARLLEAFCLQGTHPRAPHPQCYHVPAQGWEHLTRRRCKMVFSNAMRIWLCPLRPRNGLVTCRATAAPTPQPKHNIFPLSQLSSLISLSAQHPRRSLTLCGAAKAPEGRTGHPCEAKHKSPQSSHCCQSFAPRAHPPALHRAAPLAAKRRKEKEVSGFPPKPAAGDRPWAETMGEQVALPH